MFLFRLFTDQPQTKSLFYDIIDSDVEMTQETLRNNNKVTHHAERLVIFLMRSRQHHIKLNTVESAKYYIQHGPTNFGFNKRRI